MSLSLKMRLGAATKNLLADHSVSYGLTAVSGEENKPWSKYTPSGSLQFTVTNEAAPELAEGDYLVTLTRIEPPAPVEDESAADASPEA